MIRPPLTDDEQLWRDRQRAERALRIRLARQLVGDPDAVRQVHEDIQPLIDWARDREAPGR